MHKKQKLILLAVLLNIVSICVTGTVYAKEGKMLESVKEQKNILVINSFNDDYKLSKDIFTAIKVTLKKCKSTPIINKEHLDAKRYDVDQYFDELANLYKKKYKGIKIDLIVTVDQIAFDFVYKYRAEIFEDIPIVFCGVEKLPEQSIDVTNKVTGVVPNVHLKSNIDMILNISSDVEKIIIVTDPTYTKGEEFKRLKSLEKDYEGKVEFQYIINSDLYYVKAEIDSVKEKSAVLLLPWYPNHSEKFSSDIHAIRWLSSNINVPIYTTVGSYIGNGPVGGDLFFGYYHGMNAGKIIVDILNGKDIKEIPIITDNKTIKRFDYAYMSKFGITEEVLPEGALVTNKPEDTYKVDKKYLVIISISIVIILFGIIHYLLFNIRKRKLAEKNEKINKDKLVEIQEYDKIRTDFFTNVSHDLRTPINVILSAVQYIELLEKRRKDVNQNNTKKYYENIRDNSYRLLRLINNLIDMTKLDSGFLDICIKNYEIVSVVEDITLSVANYIESKGVELIFDTDVEEKVIACDAEKIERVVLNLLSNAAKFTDEGGVISVTISDKQENIEISVKDTGIGIPEEKLQEIFGRFRQVDSTLSRNKEGSGIGLSLVRSLVEKHDGRIEATSKEGEGSEFVIILPANVQEGDVVLTSQDIKQDEFKRINVEFSDV